MKISHSLITFDVIGYSATKPSDQSSLEQALKPSNVNSNEDDAFCHFSLTRARCWNATCVREDGPPFPLELKKALLPVQNCQPKFGNRETTCPFKSPNMKMEYYHKTTI
jgi:hypothetical protein